MALLTKHSIMSLLVNLTAQGGLISKTSKDFTQSWTGVVLARTILLGTSTIVFGSQIILIGMYSHGFEKHILPDITSGHHWERDGSRQNPEPLNN